MQLPKQRARNIKILALAFLSVLPLAADAPPAKFDADCFYCTKDARLTGLMIEICQLKHSTVYLLRNQHFPGRCVVAYQEHRRELYELTPAERSAYMEDVAVVARAISEVFHPDKMNYGIFGDEVSHLHVHLAPKYRGTPSWGKPFAEEEARSPLLLSPDDYRRRSGALRARILQLAAL